MSHSAEEAQSEKKTAPRSYRWDPALFMAATVQRELMSETMTDFVQKAVRLRLALISIDAPSQSLELRLPLNGKHSVIVPQCVARYHHRQKGKGGG